MIQKLRTFIRQVWEKVIGRKDIKRATGADVPISPEMVDAISLWDKLYRNQPPWRSETTIPLNLPASVAGELARLVTLELKAEITGSARADWLSKQRKPFLESLQAKIEQGAALGGMAFKPYLTGDGLAIDSTPADRFFPTGFDGSGRVTGGVFVDSFTKGDQFFTRFETHNMNADGTYTVRNTAYVSRTPDNLGTQTALAMVPAWAQLNEEVTLANIKRPLFGYFRVPFSNNIDRGSPLGVSVYARAVSLFQQADEQWARLMWEFKGAELAVDISTRAFMLDPKTGKPIIPKGQQRLFRTLDTGPDNAPLYEVFSPAIREDPLYKGLQDILRRIEFQCGLAYGTLSDAQTVEKTAEEIKSSKQRSYSTVASMQRTLESALDDLTYAMDVWATIAGLAPAGKYETSYTWDDSIITDADKEFMQRLQMAQANMLRPELVLSWYFGCTEEEAAKMVPQQTGLETLFGGGS